MLRSLSSSITGLQNHQTRMDVIGNNIANVNTTGYKANRVTFEESFSQLLQGASRPPGIAGGTNPLQVGLGMSVGSIDTLTMQGNLQATGRVLDLAMEGQAFFGVSNGSGTFYTRNGAFQLDSRGHVVLPTNGMVLQGRIADSYGEFPPGTVIGDIRIPFNEQSPARATTEVDFARNLDADAGARGTVLYSQRFMHNAQSGDTITALFSSRGAALGVKEDDVITISATVGGVYREDRYIIGSDPGEIASLAGLAAAMESTLGLPGTVSVLDVPSPDAGSIQIATPGALITNLQVTSNNPLSNPFLNTALNVPSAIAAGDTVVTDRLRAPAEAGDLLAQIFDANGDPLGLEGGDQIQVSGAVGDTAIVPSAPLVVNLATTTMAELMTKIQDDFRLPQFDGTVVNNPTVSLNAGGSNDRVPDGSLVVRGARGEAFALNNLNIRSSNSNNANPAPTFFNSNLSFTQMQQAKDTGVFDTSITVFDESGAEHVLTMSYVHTGVPGLWNWEVNMAGNETLIAGRSGTLTFGQDGSVASFIFNDGSSQLMVDPNNGADIMRIDLNVGGPGNFQGITQFASPTTVSAVSQDGYTTGDLVDISVDELGYVAGTFSNGTSRRLAQVMVVDFTNPAGLLRVSDSVYTISSNSGDPIFGQPGSQSASRLKPGALEMSNVDLAQEFTSMITTQRGYQANARVITVSDSMLEELVALKR